MLPVWSRSASSAAVLPVASSVGESLISASGDIGRVSAISLSSVAVASMGHCAAISLTCPLVARTSQPAAGPAAAVVLSGDITVAGDRSKSGSAVAGAVGHLLRSAMSWWPIMCPPISECPPFSSITSILGHSPLCAPSLDDYVLKGFPKGDPPLLMNMDSAVRPAFVNQIRKRFDLSCICNISAKFRAIRFSRRTATSTSGETPSHLSVRIDDVCPRHYQLLTSWCCNHALRWGIYALPLAG